MRTIDATLTAAFAAGTGRPILTGYIGYSGGLVLHSQDVTHYRLTGTSLEIEMPYTGDVAGDQTHIWLNRGLSIAGVEYSLTTSRFYIHSQHYLPNGRQVIKASLFPRRHYSAGGYVTYQAAIEAFCTAFGKTAVFRDPAAAWLAYAFLPVGTMIELDDANAFAALLRQKYLIFMADNGGEQVLFYSCQAGLGAADLSYSTAADFFLERSLITSRKYVWIDQNGAVHTDGLATDPTHNLGFMWSTSVAPAIHSSPSLWQMTMRPDLAVLDGDTVALTAFGATLKAFALVTEEYTAPDKGHPHPRWMTTITANEIFSNTAGGSMPSSWERVSNYAPLNTSAFNGVLSANENNLQAAMDRIDDHHRNSQAILGATFAITAANNVFQDTGLSVTLPCTGTYIIHANVRGHLQGNTGTVWYLAAELYDVTLAAAIANSERLIVLTGTAGMQLQSTTPVHMLVTVTASTVINLYAERNTDGTFTASNIVSDTNGRTSLAYTRLT